MANPLKARGAKSRANLKKGGQKGQTPEEKADATEVRKITRTLLNSPIYQARLLERLESGSIQPGVEAMLWYYAHGKPQETIETKVVVPVRIVHSYTED